MATRPLAQTLARFRLLLAEVQAKEEDLNAQVAQFRAQLARIPTQVLYSSIPLETALAVMGEVQERLESAERARRLLLTLKERVQAELQALEITARIQQAKEDLARLQSRLEREGEQEELLVEVRRLEALIAEYSQQAAQAITFRPPSHPSSSG